MSRSAVIDHGHTLRQKLLLRVIRLMSGYPAPDVIKTLLYRTNFFGEHQRALTQQVMRGPSEWQVSDRELFAAYVSRLNQCVF